MNKAQFTKTIKAIVLELENIMNLKFTSVLVYSDKGKYGTLPSTKSKSMHQRDFNLPLNEAISRLYDAYKGGAEHLLLRTRIDFPELYNGAPNLTVLETGTKWITVDILSIIITTYRGYMGGDLEEDWDASSSATLHDMYGQLPVQGIPLLYTKVEIHDDGSFSIDDYGYLI